MLNNESYFLEGVPLGLPFWPSQQWTVYGINSRMSFFYTIQLFTLKEKNNGAFHQNQNTLLIRKEIMWLQLL